MRQHKKLMQNTDRRMNIQQKALLLDYMHLQIHLLILNANLLIPLLISSKIACSHTCKGAIFNTNEWRYERAEFGKFKIQKLVTQTNGFFIIKNKRFLLW
ncbi:hypothetical protein [Lysinibacillus sphaericus]|uniref:hypothetical protein n=1 Tax=Lysinibacillus sphaericus TaxID=1421 RepID=UPI0018CDF970|nr:hypothetical protein [Lysinibacillus sphaericus]